MDFVEPPLVVPVDKVARLAGLDPDDAHVREMVEEAIRAAADDVYGHLHRFIAPTRVTEEGRWPWADGWNLDGQDVIGILESVPELDGAGLPTGYYTVTYLAGLDARTRPDLAPIRRWITAAARQHPLVRELVGTRGREIRSVAAEGQSVTYEPPPNAAAVPTAGVPPLSTLDHWRSADTLAYKRSGR